MKYFNLLFISYRDWHVSQVLSHHSYPNSLLDIELMALEPFMVWVPCHTAKNEVQRYVSYVYWPIIYSNFFFVRIW